MKKKPIPRLLRSVYDAEVVYSALECYIRRSYHDISNRAALEARYGKGDCASEVKRRMELIKHAEMLRDKTEVWPERKYGIPLFRDQEEWEFLRL